MLGGGRLGLLGPSLDPRIDDLTVEVDSDSNGTFETTELVENFTLDSGGYAPPGAGPDARRGGESDG